MVQIDVPAAFGVGCAFADAARRQLQRGGDRGFLSVLAHYNIYNSFFFVWIPIYFLVHYFGWETTHMWWHRDSVTEYPFFLCGFIVAFFVAANAGFLVGVRLVRAERLKLNRGIYLGILIGSAVWILGQLDRTAKLGSYSEWKAGTAPWFWEDTEFVISLAVAMILWSSALAAFCYKLYRDGKRLR